MLLTIYLVGAAITVVWQIVVSAFRLGDMDEVGTTEYVTEAMEVALSAVVWPIIWPMGALHWLVRSLR